MNRNELNFIHRKISIQQNGIKHGVIHNWFDLFYHMSIRVKGRWKKNNENLSSKSSLVTFSAISPKLCTNLAPCVDVPVLTIVLVIKNLGALFKYWWNPSTIRPCSHFGLHDSLHFVQITDIIFLLRYHDLIALYFAYFPPCYLN